MTRRVLLRANAVAALVTLVFSAVVLLEPGIGLPAGADVTAGAALYGRATALRSIALALLLVVLARARTQATPLLVVAGITQPGDAARHVAHGSPALATCALLLAAVPLASLRAARGIRHDVRSVDVGA